MPRLGVPDPRPSKAHPEHRAARKELERKHDGFEWATGILFALTGLAVAFNVEKDVKKCEEKHKKNDRESRGGDNGRDGRDRADRRESRSRRDHDRQPSRGSDRERERHRGDGRSRSYERPRYLDEWEREGRRQERSPREHYDDRRMYEPWDDRSYRSRPGNYSSW